jgi:CDP-diacylglycerol--glycerol-3-phosphate 3-phosphatidyltransferase
MNLPNRLTLLRILMVPLFMIFLLPFPDWVVNMSVLAQIKPNLQNINEFINNFGKYISAIVFILAASTDGLDGYIARKRKQVTNLGKFLDPIADKLLVTAALIALVGRNELTAWAATIIISREFIVTGLRLVAAADGVVISASRWGKIKTITQMIAIIAILIENYPIAWFINFPFDRYAMIVAVIVTIYSGYDYVAKNINMIAPKFK